MWSGRRAASAPAHSDVTCSAPILRIVENHNSFHVQIRQLRQKAFRVCPRCPCFSTELEIIFKKREKFDGGRASKKKNEVRRELKGEDTKAGIRGVNRSSQEQSSASFL